MTKLTGNCDVDALYIPEGWWHQVDSDEFTIAVNYWWDGARAQLTSDPRMTSYFGRVIMEELIRQESQAFLKELRASSNASFQLENADVNAITAEMTATSSQATREWFILALEDVPRQRELQTHLATMLPDDWRVLLRDASVELAAVLTAFWDATVGDGEFQSVIFGALGGEEASIKHNLLSKRDVFQRNMSRRVCQSVFGIQ